MLDPKDLPSSVYFNIPNVSSYYAPGTYIAWLLSGASVPVDILSRMKEVEKANSRRRLLRNFVAIDLNLLGTLLYPAVAFGDMFVQRNKIYAEFIQPSDIATFAAASIIALNGMSLVFTLFMLEIFRGYRSLTSLRLSLYLICLSSMYNIRMYFGCALGPFFLPLVMEFYTFPSERLNTKTLATGSMMFVTGICEMDTNAGPQFIMYSLLMAMYCILILVFCYNKGTRFNLTTRWMLKDSWTYLQHRQLSGARRIEYNFGLIFVFFGRYSWLYFFNYYSYAHVRHNSHPS